MTKWMRTLWGLAARFWARSIAFRHRCVHAEDEDELACLMRAATAGDERAYGEFLRRAASLVHGFARRKGERAGIDPEDVVQETLLAIHMKRHTWREDAPVMPWLYAIARHKLTDAFRGRGRRIKIEAEELAEGLVEPEARMLSERELGRALEMLSSGQRSAVTAVSINGHTFLARPSQRRSTSYGSQGPRDSQFAPGRAGVLTHISQARQRTWQERRNVQPA